MDTWNVESERRIIEKRLLGELWYYIKKIFLMGSSPIVAATHQSIWRHLYDSMHNAQKPKSKLKFVTLDEKSNMSALWRREEFLRIFSKEHLVEDTEYRGKYATQKKSGASHNLDPGSFSVNPFWGRRPDGVAINEALHIVYILEFNPRGKRSRSNWVAQKHYQCAQSSCSGVEIWAD